MGVTIKEINSYHEFSEKALQEQPRQVAALAERVIQPIIEAGLPDNLTHLVVATTCPDMLAPSLGQLINEKFNPNFADCHSIDVVQGCAGGVTALILGSQLAELNKSSVLVVQADAAKKAASSDKKISQIFGNGSFACLISHEDSAKGLIHTKSRQYKGLAEVVTVKLGHDADDIIMREISDMENDPRKHLGLSMNEPLALKLIKNAEAFYLDFVKESTAPDMMILHQVNPVIINHLKSVFAKYEMEFVDVVESTGNCGAATVGIALSKVKNSIHDKKVLLCSFGTGGVITAGLWQN